MPVVSPWKEAATAHVIGPAPSAQLVEEIDGVRLVHGKVSLEGGF